MEEVSQRKSNRGVADSSTAETQDTGDLDTSEFCKSFQEQKFDSRHCVNVWVSVKSQNTIK